MSENVKKNHKRDYLLYENKNWCFHIAFSTFHNHFTTHRKKMLYYIINFSHFSPYEVKKITPQSKFFEKI